MNDTTKFPATHVVFWPGQEVMACQRHLQDLYTLNRMMGGLPLSARELTDSDGLQQCSNCVNENTND